MRLGCWVQSGVFKKRYLFFGRAHRWGAGKTGALDLFPHLGVVKHLHGRLVWTPGSTPPALEECPDSGRGYLHFAAALLS
jgi:hypothetical protein